MKLLRVKYGSEQQDQGTELGLKESSAGKKSRLTMSMTISTKEKMQGSKVHVVSKDERVDDMNRTLVNMGRKYIRECCSLIGTTGESLWYTTLTYAKGEQSGRVGFNDLKLLMNKCCSVSTSNRFLGVIELNKEGGVHLHCLSSVDISSMWTKGFVHSRERFYCADKAGVYLSKQYGNGVEYPVKFRTKDKTVTGMEGFRRLWKNMPYAIVDTRTNDLVRNNTKESVITQEMVDVGEGELFAVIKADLSCLSSEELSSLDVKGFRARLNNLHMDRGRNGTLYANNNANKPSPLVTWMIANKKDVLISTFKKAKDDLLGCPLGSAQNNVLTNQKVL